MPTDTQKNMPSLTGTIPENIQHDALSAQEILILSGHLLVMSSLLFVHKPHDGGPADAHWLNQYTTAEVGSLGGGNRV